MKKLLIMVMIMLSCGGMMFACSNEGQDKPDETERRSETESFEIDEEVEFAKRQGQVGFFSTYDTKYAFAEAEIKELEDTFFAPHTVNFDYTKLSESYCEGEDGDIFMFNLLPAYGEDGEKLDGSLINGILKLDKYGSAERICIDPYCADVESQCNHMNLYGQPWGYHDNSLYFVCPKWYEEKGFIGSYLLEFSLDDRDFYKIVDIPVGSFIQFKIIDGYAYIWCYNGGSSEVLKEGQSAVAVVDLDNNRACIYEDDIPIVCGIADGKIVAFMNELNTTPSLIDPNTNMTTNLGSHSGGWNTRVCGLIGKYIIHLNSKTNELIMFDMETENLKTIDDNVFQFKVGEKAVWYTKYDHSLFSYNPHEKNRDSVCKNVKDYIVNGCNCLYITSSSSEPDVIYSTELQFVMSDDGEDFGDVETVVETYVYSDANIWLFTDGQSKRLYQIGNNEYIESARYCWLGSESAIVEAMLYDGEIRSYIERNIVKMNLSGGRNESIGRVYGSGYYIYSTPGMPIQ